jgi:BirA family transcriptional regulator, biotin operon repressor / biotin---[acetyl-CoA-carboxylase] ligase
MSRPAPLVQRVLGALADGSVHSGQQLAARARVSRSAVWKAVGALRDLGVTINATPHRGYQLAAPFMPLAVAPIEAQLPAEVRARRRHLDVAWSLESTNDSLLARGAPPSGAFDLQLAEHQSAGRGRRARPWFAPPGGALCLSLGWSFATLPREAPSLSLAVGVCALRALAAFTAAPLQLKWPNDLYAQGRKLGGILIELQAESAGPAFVVIGIGINCRLGAGLSRRVLKSGTTPVDLAALGLHPIDRNQLAAALTRELVRGLLQFTDRGLAAFAAEWRAADALAGLVVDVDAPGGRVVGHARGIDAEGALCVQGVAGLQRFTSAEVSVRAQK